MFEYMSFTYVCVSSLKNFLIYVRIPVIYMCLCIKIQEHLKKQKPGNFLFAQIFYGNLSFSVKSY